MITRLFPGAKDGKEAYESLASSVGAPDDAIVTITSVGHYTKLFSDDLPLDAVGIRVHVSHPKLDSCRRFIGIDKEGNRFVKNEIIGVSPKYQKEGLGVEIFSRQVENASVDGFAYISTHAAGKHGSNMNGYYTWPRFGYDESIQSLSRKNWRLARKVKEKYPEAKSIRDVMKTKEGRDWWKENGADLRNARFDLTEGSVSRQVLNAYIEERAAKKADKSFRFYLTKGRPVPPRLEGDKRRKGEEIVLTPEEEEALERAWETLFPEDHPQSDKREKALSWLNETSGGSLVGSTRKVSVSLLRSAKAISPPRVGESYFGSCKRDRFGRCLPSGQADQKPAARPRPVHAETADAMRTFAGSAQEAAGHAVSTLVELGGKLAGEAGGKVSERVEALKQNVHPSVRAPLGNIWHAVHSVLMSLNKASQALAAEVGRQKGLSSEQVDRLGKVLSAIDLTFEGAAMAAVPVAVATAPPLAAAAKAASYVPVASIGYLLYSTATDPKSVMKGAVESLKAKFPDQVRGAAKFAYGALRHPLTPAGHHPTGQKGVKSKEDRKRMIAGELAERVKKHGDRADEYLALFSAALDEVRDVSEALRMADEVTASGSVGAKGWVTIGGGPCDPEEGQHCGGTAVFIDGSGNITKGPPKLVGKKPHELSSGKKPKPPKVPKSSNPDKKPAVKPKPSKTEAEDKPKIGKEPEPPKIPSGWGQIDAGSESAAEKKPEGTPAATTKPPEPSSGLDTTDDEPTPLPDDVWLDLVDTDQPDQNFIEVTNGEEQSLVPQDTNSEQRFPDSVINMDVIKQLGGSTGAVLVEDSETGLKFVVKGGASEEHAQEEFAADRAYEALGIAVPEGKLYDTYDGLKKVTKYIEGKSLGEFLKGNPTDKQRLSISKQIRDGFVADALLGNWDVIGLNYDNILVDKDGKVWRIDNGGSLRFRAQGAKKHPAHFGEAVTEIDSLRNPNINPQTAAYFGGVTEGEIAEQVKQVVAKKDALLKTLPEDLRGVMGKRVDWLAEHYGKSKEAPTEIPGSMFSGKGKDWPSVSPSPDVSYVAEENVLHKPLFAPLKDSDFRKDPGVLPKSFLDHHNGVLKSLPAPELNSVKYYTGSGYDPMNRMIRKCPETLDCLDGANRGMAEHIEKAIAKAGVMKHPVNVWRGVSLFGKDKDNFMAAMKRAMETGEDVRMPGFKSFSVLPNTGGDWGDLTFELRAKTGLYVAPVSKLKYEKELLQGHNVRYRVTGIKEVPFGKSKSGGKRTVIQLEEIHGG